MRVQLKRSLIVALVLVAASDTASAQVRCAIPPTPQWPVQFYERWQDVAAAMVSADAYGSTFQAVKINSASKTGFAVTFEVLQHYTDCQPANAIPASTAGWHRALLASPSAAEAFAAALPTGTPVGIITFHGGYTAGAWSDSSRLRGVTHALPTAPLSSWFAPRATIVLYFDATGVAP